MPIRMCIACGKRKSVSLLLRVVRTADGGIVFDPRRRLPGRGAHVCRSVSCLNRAIEKHCFNRAFQARMDNDRLRDLLLEFDAGCSGKEA